MNDATQMYYIIYNNQAANQHPEKLGDAYSMWGGGA